jgi:hypothetical protein
MLILAPKLVFDLFRARTRVSFDRGLIDHKVGFGGSGVGNDFYCLDFSRPSQIQNRQSVFGSRAVMKNLRLRGMWHKLAAGQSQFAIVVCGLCVLLLVEWVLETRLITTANGTHFATNDGKMAEAVVRTAYRFAAWFNVTNLNPLQGVGSQLLPLNVWADPVYWPLAFFDGKLATDLAGLVALTCIAVSCYVMARCFDLPPLPSVIAAQVCLVWFGPIGPLLGFTASFVLMPGLAAVYAPYMLTLGLLARLDPGRVWNVLLTIAAVAALIFYSLYCDPLWSVVTAISWAVPFAVVAFSPLRMKAIVLRCAALAVSLALLVLGGPLLYAYTMTQFTARVYFSAAVERAFSLGYGSILFTSPNARSYYGLCALGWALGLVLARGRVRVLVAAGAAAFGFYVLYALAFLLLKVNWWLPLPIYVEHCLPYLLMASAVAGYWSALQWIAAFARPRAGLEPLGATVVRRPAWRVWVGFVAGLVAVALVPVGGLLFALERSKSIPADAYTMPWSDERQFVQYLSDHIGLGIGKPYRGSAVFLPSGPLDIVSVANLWNEGIPTVNEYSQLLTPQAVFLKVELFKQGPEMNFYWPWIGSGQLYGLLFKTFQALGVRYVITHGPLEVLEQHKFASLSLPRHQPPEPPGRWQIYQLPDPNAGHYSPTEIVVADSAAQIIAGLADTGFDFRRQVIVAADQGLLVPARDMRLTMNRGGGFHLTGHSDGTSLVILPQQFTNCLKASDRRVRIVRANLLWTGVVFSGDVDTDVRFGYGMFSPGCRRDDLADMRRLKVALPDAPQRTEPGRDDVMARLRAAIAAVK